MTHMFKDALNGFLEASPWFDRIDPAEQAKIKAETVIKRVPAGACLCREDEAPAHWYGVIDGLMKMCITGEDGEAMTLIGLPPGSWFGEGTVVKMERRRYDVVALRDSAVACLPVASFQRLYETNIGFTHFIIEQLNERLKEFITISAASRTHTATEKVALALARLFNASLYPGADYELKVSQEEVANLAGVSRPRCNQALKRLRADGLIDIGYGTITILDLERLRGFADCSPPNQLLSR